MPAALRPRRRKAPAPEVGGGAGGDGVRHDGKHVRSVVETGEGRDERPVDAVVSSMALRDLVLALDPPAPTDVLEAARRLRYRDLMVVGLVIDDEEPFLTTGSTCTTRTRARGASRTTGPEAPTWCGPGRRAWASSTSASGATTSGSCRRRPSGWRRPSSPLQDHSMWTGILAALNVVDGAVHDVWSVNEDSEYRAGVGAAGLILCRASRPLQDGGGRRGAVGHVRARR